ncbi:MAG: hypothetical protein O7G85_14780 [Planctomycetota bacterium]|nr:hypothetical protein [Planctomycetota bacterium]
MAIFRKKPPSKEEGADNSNGDAKFEPNPERARTWFEHARTASDSTNYDYALNCYANGLMLDPETMSAHEAMMEVAVRYLNNGGKPASGKEIRSIEKPHDVGRFVMAEFAWMKDFMNSSLALKALEAAVKAEQLEWGNSVAPKVFGILRNKKKVSKSAWLNALGIFRDVHAFDQAMGCGNAALVLDPNDSSLDHELRNLSAQRAMDQGNYEEAAGEEGGFRGMIKDMDKQRELDEADRMAVSGSAQERKIETAQRKYEANSLSPENINKYAMVLRKQSTPESIKKAYQIYMQGFKDTGEYRFRMFAGDLKIEKARRKERKAIASLEEDAENSELQQQREELKNARMELEMNEFSERAEKYPTDRKIRFQLGELAMEVDDHGKAMENFQFAKDEPKLRVRASHMLGQCFAEEDWHNEAIEEFKEALEAIDVADRDRELDIRYDLMLSLIAYAKNENDADLAREARDICSNIARKNIGFRDIRTKRSEVEKLLKAMSGGGSSN